MKSKFFIALAAIWLTAACATAQTADYKPIPADPSVRTGVLPNGLTYYVKQNNYPSQHVDFFIAQRVGSIQEEEDQRGLAHFLEHMCFNGTKHFPGNSLITYMESIGVKFGANLNAYTSTDETVYNISNVPSTRRSALDSCFLVLSDWSHELLLTDKDIDEERGVIEGEWRHRSGANYRLMEKVSPEIYPNCLYGRRMPIGLMSVVKNFKYNTLRDYYKKWYHPGNQAIIVVGDIDPDWAVERINELFGSIRQPKKAAPVVAVDVPDNNEIISVVATDPEQTQTVVRLFYKHADLAPELMPTTAFIRNDYLKSVVAAMFSARFDDLKKEPDAPFTNVRAADRDFMISKTRQAFQITAITKSGMAMRSVMAVEREVNRALRYGFTDGEYRRAMANYRNSVNKLYLEREKYPNSRYARDFVRAFIDGEPIPSIEQYHELAMELIPTVTLNDVNAYFRSVVTNNDRNVVLVTYAPEKDAATLPSAADLEAAYKLARKADVEPYVDHVKDGELLAALPEPGAIVAEDVMPDFGAKVWTLSNGMHVYLKHTDLNPNEIILAGTSPGGLSQNYTDADAPTFKAINNIMAVSAFGGFTQDDLKKTLAGKDVKLRTFVSRTEEGFQGSTTPKDVETEFQLLYLKLTAPERDDRAFEQLLVTNRERLANQDSDPKFEFADSLFAGVFNHHPLAAEKLQRHEVDRVNYDVALNCYRDRFADLSDMNVFIVGNFDEKQMRALVCQYLATLPGAGRKEQPRDINYRLFKGNVVNEWTRTMENPQDKVYFFWTNQWDYNLRNTLVAKIAGQIFHDRFLKMIREERGWTYHVDSHCSLVTDINGNDAPVIFFPLNVTVTAGNAPATRQLIRAEIDNVAQNGVTPDELNSVKQYLRKVHNEDIEDNSYWMVQMNNTVKRGLNFDKDYLATLEAITPEDIRLFVTDVILPGSRLELQMTPR